MSRTDLTPSQQRAAWGIGMLSGVVAVALGYVILAPRAPGNVAVGFLGGGVGVLLLLALDRLRVMRGTETGSAARWAAASPDERDDRILTRSLAVVGYVGILASSVGAVAMFAGAGPGVVLGILPGLMLVTLVISFVVISRRS